MFNNIIFPTLGSASSLRVCLFFKRPPQGDGTSTCDPDSSSPSSSEKPSSLVSLVISFISCGQLRTRFSATLICLLPGLLMFANSRPYEMVPEISLLICMLHLVLNVVSWLQLSVDLFQSYSHPS